MASDPDRGSFVVQVDAFEDRGARWELGLEEIARLQFPRDAPAAGPATLAALREARRRVARRRGEPRLIAVLEEFLAERGLLELDRRFARAFVSNPRAGELVKGHALILAELGLCPYSGPIARDPRLLVAPDSRALRARHIVARLGFARALWTAWGLDTVTLYRAAATDAPLAAAEAPSGSFVSASFSAAVAEAHFAGGPTTVAAVMWRRRVPVERLFMTFMETAALNERFLEAEAVLVGVSFR